MYHLLDSNMLAGVWQIGQKLRLKRKPITAIIEPMVINILKSAINVTTEVIAKPRLAVFLLLDVLTPARNGKPIPHKINAAIVGLVIARTFC